MIITKIGEVTKEFKFICGNCNSEWHADRKEVNFTPPFMELKVYMKCPCCGYTTYSKECDRLCKALDNEDILDKIRAEIDGLTYYWCEVHPRSVIDDVLEIIDKYRK